MYFRNTATGEELTYAQLKARMNLSFPLASPPEGWVEHVYQIPDDTPKTYSSNEFFDFFTEAEQVAIVNASMTDVASKLWYDRMWGSDFIDPLDERVELGLMLLVGKGLITEDRMEEILGQI